MYISFINGKKHILRCGDIFTATQDYEQYIDFIIQADDDIKLFSYSIKTGLFGLETYSDYRFDSTEFLGELDFKTLSIDIQELFISACFHNVKTDSAEINKILPYDYL